MFGTRRLVHWVRSVWKIDQSKSCCTSKAKTGWNHKTLAFKKEVVVLGTEANGVELDGS